MESSRKNHEEARDVDLPRGHVGRQFPAPPGLSAIRHRCRCDRHPAAEPWSHRGKTMRRPEMLIYPEGMLAVSSQHRQDFRQYVTAADVTGIRPPNHGVIEEKP